MIDPSSSPGDREAALCAMQEHRGELFAYLLGMLGRRQDAEDALQSAMLHAWRGLAAYEERQQSRSWLYAIARNEALMVLRRRRRKPETLVDPSLLLECEGRDEGADARLHQKERSLALYRAIAGLPEAEREVVWLRLKSDLTFREIAELTGAPLNTVLGRMHNATRRLRDMLKGFES